MKLLDTLSHHITNRGTCDSLAIQLDIECGTRSDIVYVWSTRYDGDYSSVARKIFKTWLNLEKVRRMNDRQKKAALEDAFVCGMGRQELAMTLQAFYGVPVS